MTLSLHAVTFNSITPLKPHIKMLRLKPKSLINRRMKHRIGNERNSENHVRGFSEGVQSNMVTADRNMAVVILCLALTVSLPLLKLLYLSTDTFSL